MSYPLVRNFWSRGVENKTGPFDYIEHSVPYLGENLVNKKVIYIRATSLMGWAQCTLCHIPEHLAPASLLDIISKYRRVALDWLMNANPDFVYQSFFGLITTIHLEREKSFFQNQLNGIPPLEVFLWKFLYG